MLATPRHVHTEIYGLLVVLFASSGIFLFSVAFTALYGMGGKELFATIFFITFCGMLRLCIPPWDETLNSLFSGLRFGPKTTKVFAIDHFSITEKQEILASSCCPICLQTWIIGDKLAMGRVCRHVFHENCLHPWISRSTSCPYCRCDLQEQDLDLGSKGQHNRMASPP